MITNYLGSQPNSWSLSNSGGIVNNGGFVDTGYTGLPSSGTVGGFALNLDDNQISFYVNGVFQTTKNISAGTYYAAASNLSTTSYITVTANFGGSAFVGAVPAGFTAYNG